MSIIEVKNLKKTYKIAKNEGRNFISNFFNPHYVEKEAVKGIDFQIEKGEIVGCLGMNGAGKSTTIKMLTGILTPTDGSVLVNGIVPYKNRIANNKNLGAVFGQRTQMWWDLPPIDSFSLAKTMYGMSNELYQKNLNEFSELLSLKELMHVPVRQLSLGQKMRCEIALAFMHNPKVVYLDEPTIGLDVMVKQKIRDFIKNINHSNKTTVVLTTHDMQDVDELANRIILIHDGNKIYDNTLQLFKKEYGGKRTATVTIAEDALSYANDFLDIDVSFISSDVLSIRFESVKYTAKEIIDRVSEKFTILDFSVEDNNLETIVKDVFADANI